VNDQRLESLIHDAFTGRLSRREVLRRAGTLGLSLPVVAALLAACGGGGGTSGTSTSTNSGATTAPTVASTGASPAATSSPTTQAASPVASPSSASPAGAAAYTVNNPPPVPNAAAAKQYSGQKITYYGDSVGIGAQIDQVMAKRFNQDTGITVNVIPRPQSSTDAYSTYLRFFQAKSTDVDVVSLDVIWPGAFAAHLLDLSQTFASEAKLHYAPIIQNGTVGGKLIAMPWFSDFGILYYRTDLLQKYGFSTPPQTWEELQTQAQKIMTGERSSNANFQGFVFQGNAYEGLTCNALEWIDSSGGGTIIENGKVTLNNPQAIAALNRAKGWLSNGIAPRGVTSYQEDDARNVFQGGNCAFMRNWPYAYALGNGSDSKVAGKFDVAPLPTESGQKSVGTIGGWMMGISAYSKAQQAATEWVRYTTSAESQTYRAVVGSFVPTQAAVAQDPSVVQAEPFLKSTADVVRVARPSTETGDKYNQISTIFFQGVSQILNGQDAASIVPNVTQQIQRQMS